MARPLRIEFAGALYHVTSRGDGRDNIYFKDEDRDRWLDVLGHVCERFNWLSHAYCQMSGRTRENGVRENARKRRGQVLFRAFPASRLIAWPDRCA